MPATLSGSKMGLLKAKCSVCGAQFEREARRIKYAEKHGRAIVCSAQCRSVSGNLKRGVPLSSARPNKKPWDRKPENRLKRQAHKIVGNALADGRLERQPCERCGAEKVHAHHDDYSKPLDVMWLCPKHHRERHRELDEMETAKAAA